MKASSIKAIATVFVIVVASIAGVEAVSWAVVSAYDGFVRKAPPAAAATVAPVGEERAFVTDEQILTDYREIMASGQWFTFESYVMYRQTEQATRHYNIDGDGIRSNGPNTVDPGAATTRRHVWMFGSSALLGTPATSDDETIAAHLETILNDRYPDRGPIAVTNFGTSGYVSLQDLLRLRFELAKRPKPDLIVVYNGFNGSTGHIAITEAPFVQAQLEYLWRLHADKALINWNRLHGLKRFFSNTTNLILKMNKFFLINSTDFETWKADYLAEAKQSAEALDANLATFVAFHIDNVAAMVDIATSNGIAVVVANQPNMYASTKDFVARESRVYGEYLKSWFAATREELDAFSEIPTSYLFQKRKGDLQVHRRWYAEQARRLEQVCVRTAALCADVQGAVDADPDLPIYYDPVHLTSVGNRKAAEALFATASPIVDSWAAN